MSKISNPHNEIATFYRALFAFSEGYDPVLAEGLCEILRKHDAIRILDCGCGAGNPSIGLARLGFEVTGVDTSNQMLEMAKQNAADIGVKLTLKSMPMEGMSLLGVFDCILCHDCLYEFKTAEQLTQLFRTMRTSLRQEGCLYVATKMWDTEHDREKRDRTEDRGEVTFNGRILKVSDVCDTNTLTVKLTSTKADGTASTQSINFPWFPYSPNRIAGMLINAGFSSVQVPVLVSEEEKYNCVGIIGL